MCNNNFNLNVERLSVRKVFHHVLCVVMQHPFYSITGYEYLNKYKRKGLNLSYVWHQLVLYNKSISYILISHPIKINNLCPYTYKVMTVLDHAYRNATWVIKWYRSIMQWECFTTFAKLIFWWKQRNWWVDSSITMKV